MKNFIELPENVKSKVKETLRAYDEANVTFYDGEYHVSVAYGLRSSYPSDFEVIGYYYASEVYSDDERILNYVNEFRSFPIEYHGKRDYSILRDYSATYTFDSFGNIVKA